jgi:F-type H+-transporting ATPase subunit delta
MSEVKVASRYAKSLIDLAQEQNVLKSVRSDIEQFIDTCRVNPKLRAVLKNPIIGSEKKSFYSRNHLC